MSRTRAPAGRAHRSENAPERRRPRTAPKPRRRRRIVAPKPATTRFRVGRPAVRLRIVLVVLLLVLTGVLVKVARIQSAGGEAFREAAAKQWTRTEPIPADRGSIFDRGGEELAVSIPAYAVSVNPKLVTDATGTAKLLQSMLALDDSETSELYDELVAKDRGFVYVRRQVDAAIGEQIADMDLVGVNVDPESRRILPGGDTGRSVIGRTDIDGNGIAGLEAQYDELLTGVPGELTKEVATRGRSIAGTEQVDKIPVPGNDIVLTIDRSIQFATEQALLGRVSELGAKSGYVIVMDVHSGDILGMASVQRNDEGVVEITSGNYAVTNAYEPGSVAKVVTIAAALNEGAVEPDTTFLVPWRKEYGEVMLSDSHQHPDEIKTVEQILVESSNIGTIETQIAIGRGDWDTARQVHWDYLRRFGFGEESALDFPGESAGILKHWTDLWGSERVTVAYGQGFAATPIQMVAAMNALANDGTYVAPRLVKATVDSDGDIVDAPPSPTRDVVTPETAETMQEMMRQVVCRGTATRAQIGVENLSIAGKTGTGLKAQPNGGYVNAQGQRVYYASFAGFFPAEDPQVSVLVSIDEPPAGDINRFGGTAAAPVFAELAPTIMHELGMQPPENSQPCPP